MLRKSLRWLRASSVFTGIGAAVGGLILSVGAFFSGPPAGFSELVEGLTFFGGVGALCGTGFAAAVSVIGRVGRSGDRFPVWKGGVAGAIGVFLAPMALSLVLAGIPETVPVLQWLLGYGAAVWWLAPLGGVLGIGVGMLAHRAPSLREAYQRKFAVSSDGGSRVARAYLPTCGFEASILRVEQASGSVGLGISAEPENGCWASSRSNASHSDSLKGSSSATRSTHSASNDRPASPSDSGPPREP